MRVVLLELLVLLAARAAEWTVEELEQIFQEEGTDKQARDPGHAYVHAYAMMLGPWRSEVRNILEVGIGSVDRASEANMRFWWFAMRNYHHVKPEEKSYQPGASLRSWRRYFPNARVIGLDIDPKAVARAKVTKGVEAFVANTSAPESLERLQLPQMDVIVDDGDHRWHAQQETLLALWPLLKPRGYYFMEDANWTAIHHGDAPTSPAARQLLKSAGAFVIHSDAFGRAGLAGAKKRDFAAAHAEAANIVCLMKPSR